MYRRVTIAIGLLSLAACEQARQVPQHSVADFYRNNDFFGASFSHDNSRILVGSNQSGVYNAYAVPLAGGAPQALTTSTTDAIVPITYFPHDDRILYRSDQGGNELAHLYVLELDGKARDVTPGKKLNADFMSWSGDWKSFFAMTNERDARYFDVYQYETDGYGRTLLYRNNEGYQPSAVSRNGRYVALMRANSSGDVDVFVYDNSTKRSRLLTPHEGKINFGVQDFTPDGSAILLTSDEGREFQALWRLALDSGAKTAVLSPEWDVVGAGYSRSGRYLVVTVNQEARLMSHVYDAASMAEAPLTGLPQGLVRGLRMSEDDSRFAFYNSDGSTPDDLWAGQRGAAPTRLTTALSSAIAREDLVVPAHVRFKSYDSLEIPGILYRPHQASPSAKVPGIVLVHGGPGGQAIINYSPLVQALVNHGYAVFDINNRGSSGYGKTFYHMDDRKHGEADLADVVASRGMLAQTGYVDSARIGILGGSYGGYMTLAAVTLQPDAFDVGVDLFGISNWVRTLSSIPPWWASFRKSLYDEMGDPATDSIRLRRISPLFNADRIRVPLMVLQGANDPRVLKVESDEIVAAAKKNGVPVEYIVFPDEGHGFVKKDNEIKGYTAIIEFLDKYLRGGKDGRIVAAR